MPLSKRSKLSVLFSMLALIAIISGLLITGTLQRGAAAHAAGSQFTRQIPSAGTISFTSTADGTTDPAWPEFAGATDNNPGPAAYNGSIVDRSQSPSGNNGVSVNSGKKAKSNPQLNLSFDGLNHRQQRLANGGNQFSVEPPDQGLCASSSYVMESVNDVLRVFDTNGNPLSGVVDLNTFYGYRAAINRTTHIRGPFVTDPSCYFDQSTQRWFHV